MRPSTKSSNSRKRPRCHLIHEKTSVSTKSGPGERPLASHLIQGGQQPIDLLVGRFPVAKRVDVLDPAYLPLCSELVDLARRPEVSASKPITS